MHSLTLSSAHSLPPSFLHFRTDDTSELKKLMKINDSALCLISAGLPITAGQQWNALFSLPIGFNALLKFTSIHDTVNGEIVNAYISVLYLI